MSNQNETLRDVIKKWGKKHQTERVIEELAELIVALTKLDRTDNLASKSTKVFNVANEVADVEIMLKQIRLMYPEVNRLVPSIHAEKIKRLEGKINS